MIGPLPPILACGAWLKNRACLLDAGGRAHWSEPHGDLGHPAASAALAASAAALLAQHAPVEAVAHDLHPDFFSTRLAVDLAQTLGVPAIGVQHHHAHIAAVMAGHGIDGPVIGLALDGVGLGTDGQAWGGELLLVDGAAWQRLGHLYPLALPGGDRAAREPWRMAASALHALGRGTEIVTRFAPAVGQAAAQGVRQMLDRGFNCPPSSSTGRWFDAAAAALGLSLRQHDEAEAALALEKAADRWLLLPSPASGRGAGGEGGDTDTLSPTPLPLVGEGLDAEGQSILDPRPLFAALLDVDAADVDAAAARFHLALAEALAQWAIAAARERAARIVCLGGGCFFNRILRQRVTARLREADLQVLSPLEGGYGDAGLALGQAWVAARQLRDRQILSPSHTEENALCV
ncbi:MAG: carbamoyltransferase HypF [Azonexus sp.]|jgi:hydrogenase maturation protein HypF|nr:carbamoyltransferase HypF [Azonexus sp.]